LAAALAAVENILCCKAPILSLDMGFRTRPEEPGIRLGFASIVVEHEGRKRRGTASDPDPIHACIAAFIEAVIGCEGRTREAKNTNLPSKTSS
jgi:hypothetical protein